VNIVSDKVVRHLLVCLSGSRRTSPNTWKFGRNWSTLFKNANF